MIDEAVDEGEEGNRDTSLSQRGPSGPSHLLWGMCSRSFFSFAPEIGASQQAVYLRFCYLRSTVPYVFGITTYATSSA